MSTTLTNTSISLTYPGLLQAQGAQLPAVVQTAIYDGVGNLSSISIGRANTGIRVTGTFTNTSNISSGGYVKVGTSTLPTNHGLTLVTLDYIQPYVLQKLYPVGSVYISTSLTTAAAVIAAFGFGTWVAYGAGRVIIGAGTTVDTGACSKTFTGGSCGGEFVHKLTLSEIPAHSHKYTCINNNFIKQTCAGSGNCASFIGTATNGGTTTNSGSSLVHNNIQPYITTYMYYRSV